MDKDKTMTMQVKNVKRSTVIKLKTFATSKDWKMAECLEYIAEKLIPPIK